MSFNICSILYGLILYIERIFGEIGLLSFIITPNILFFFWANKNIFTKEHIVLYLCNNKNILPNVKIPNNSSKVTFCSSSLNSS